MGKRLKTLRESWAPRPGDPTIWRARGLGPEGEFFTDRLYWIVAVRNSDLWVQEKRPDPEDYGVLADAHPYARDGLEPACVHCQMHFKDHGKKGKCLYHPTHFEIHTGKSPEPKPIVHKMTSRTDATPVCHWAGCYPQPDGCPARWDWKQVTCPECLKHQKALPGKETEEE